MFDKFGEFDSFEELNKAAAGLKEEGDTESLKELTKENGIDVEDAVDFIDGVTDMLTTFRTASIGKLEIEAAALTLPDDILISDWVNQVKTYVMRDDDMCRAVRRKGKRLIDCLGRILKRSFENQWEVPKDILKAAGVYANRVTFGVPSAASVNKIIKDYYLEEATGEKE